jgi:hypothetical protein
VPLGVGWLFQDVTEAKLAAQDADKLRFRSSQLHRAGRAAGECESPMEAATVCLDFALVGFADHALIDLVLGDVPPGGSTGDVPPTRLVRVAATPGGSVGPCQPVSAGGIPVRYREGHPALQAVARTGSVRASAPSGTSTTPTWSVSRQWPPDSVHALCTVLRSRGRTLGVVTFLRGASRPSFERADAVYAEDVTARMAASLDLLQSES